ncbi:MAG: hypothetical protein WBH31_17810, partial [Promethearchaeia archaeon]
FINEYNNSRTVYYFTSQRLIKWIEKKILYQRKKEIKYADISHLIDWYTALEIVPKNKNGQLYYEGDETEFFHKFRGLKSLKILLHGSKGKKLNKEIINLLVQGIPLKKHPNLEFLYFKEKLAKEKENIIMVREIEESNNEIEQEVSQISKRQIRIFLVGIISIIITFYILIWSGLIVLIILPIGIYCIMTYAILSLEKRKKLLKKKTKDKNL